MNPKEQKSQELIEQGAMDSLREKLKLADIEISQFVIALEKENFKLVKQIAKLQSENVTLNSKIAELEEKEQITQANVNIIF